MNLSYNELMLLGTLVIIIIAIVIASRNSTITIKRDLPPEDRPRPKPALQPAPKAKKSETKQKPKYTKPTAKTTNTNGWEPQNIVVNGENVLIDNRSDGEITVISVDLGTKLPAPLEIDLRNSSDIFAQLTGLFKNVPKEQLKHYAILIREIKGLLELGANYINLGHNTTRVIAEMPVPLSIISQEMITETAQYLVSIKKKLTV